MSGNNLIAEELRALSPIAVNALHPAIEKTALIFDDGWFDEFNAQVLEIEGRNLHEPWKLCVLRGLAAANFGEIRQLLTVAAMQGFGSTSALAARNLLELNIWSGYAGRSNVAMRRIFEDAGRDAKEIHEVLWALSKGDDSNQHPPPQTACGQEQLATSAAAVGITNLTGQYLAVKVAARELDPELEFSRFNKILSKFAHPAAMTIIGNHTEASEVQVRGFSLGLGCNFFCGSIESLTTLLNKFTNECSYPA